MHKIFTWVKTHPTAFLLGLIFLYLIWPKMPFSQKLSYDSYGEYGGVSNSFFAPALTSDMSFGGGGDSGKNYQLPQENRMVVSNTNMSLLVKNVRETVNLIEDQTILVKGYVVNKSVSSMEENANANLSVRVPNDQLKSYLEFLRANALKVTYENTSGNDVTDSYYDSDARLAVLTSNKEKIQDIMARAETVDEMLRVQTQLFSIQDQIDAIKGRMSGLDARSKTTLISIAVSSDEYALPYAPVGVWKPNIVFKQAVRALVKDLSSLGSSLIWIGVYSIIWIPVVFIVSVAVRFFRRRMHTNGQIARPNKKDL